MVAVTASASRRQSLIDLRVFLQRSQVAAHAAKRLFRYSLRGQLGSLDFQSAAQLNEFTRPRRTEHQSPTEGPGQEFGDAVPKIGAGAGTDHHDAQDFQGAPGSPGRH